MRRTRFAKGGRARGPRRPPPDEGGGHGVALGGERGPVRDDEDATTHGTPRGRHDEGRADERAGGTTTPPPAGAAGGGDDVGRAVESTRDADPAATRALIVFAGDGRAPSTLAGELRARGAD
eukprot:6204104-Pleurochrysis_carterae.AAC.1